MATIRTGYRGRPRNKLGPLDWTYRPLDFQPHTIGVDGVCYGHREADRVLAYTVDGGASMVLGQDFAAGGLCQSGEYVIWMTRTTDGYVVVTSSDVGVPGNFGGIWFSASFTGPFTKVQATAGINHFCMSKPELGPTGHTLLVVGEYSTDSPQPPHHLYLSQDGGQTWSTIRTAQVIDPLKNSHYHGAAYDTLRQRIWSSQGDNQNALWSYTDNFGTNWTDCPMLTTDPLYQSDSVYMQPTAVIVFPATGRLGLTPDRGSVAPFYSGVWGASAATGLGVSVQFVTPGGEFAPNCFGRAPYVQAGNVAIVNIPDRFTGTNKAYFVGTGDGGVSWHLCATVNLSAPGSGSVPFVGPDNAGLCYWKSTGNPAPAGNNLLVAAIPYPAI